MKRKWLRLALSAILLCGCKSSTANDTATTPQPSSTTRDIRQMSSTVSRETGEMRITRPQLGEVVPMGIQGTWTIFIYLCGSNLESGGSAASNDMWEMLNGTYSDNVRFVIETGGSTQWHFVDDNTIPADRNQRFLIQNGGAYRVGDEPHSPMGDSKTLASFLKWGMQNYASEHMGLILWDHGGGSVSGVCYDEIENNYYDNYDLLTLSELDAALLSVFQDMTDKFEFIGFDACLMSTIETANIVASYADYMIASPESEPANGWDYTAIANALAANPNCSAESLGRQICDSYLQSYADNSFGYGIATMSLLKLSETDRFLRLFNEFSKELYESAQDITNMSTIVRAIQNAENFGGNNPEEGYTNMVDLGKLIEACAPFANTSGQLLSAMQQLVPYKVSGSRHPDTSGLSIFYPLKMGSSTYMNSAATICVSPYYLSFVNIQNNGAVYTDVAYAYYNNTDLEQGNTWDPGNIDIEEWNNQNGYSYNENEGVYETTGDSNVYTYTDEEIHWGNSPFITFSEYPQVNADGEYYCRLDDMGRTFISDIKAKCYELNYEERDFIELGETCQIYGSWEDGYFRDGFDGNWLSLPDGQNIAIYVLERRSDCIVYSSPVRINGEDTFLRLNWHYDGHVTIEGTWNGLDESGTASRINPPPAQGDEVIPLFYAHNAETHEKSKYRGNPYIVEDSLYIESSYLEAGEYWYNFYIFDIFGDYKETEPVNLITDGNGSKPMWAYG